MAKIPSTEQTDDFIYRVEIKNEAPLYNRNEPNLLVFETYVEPSSGTLHSIDVSILRDGQRAANIDLCSFEHMRGVGMSGVKATFCETAHCVAGHNYLLTMILRYLVG
jgi:hypothetical protein